MIDMDIRIKATDYEITPEVSSYLNERLVGLEKLLATDSDNARCEVEIGRDAGGSRHGANMWFAEIHIMQPGFARVYARNNASSVNEAITDVKEEIERQLRREKKLHIRVMRKTGAAVKSWMRFGRD